MLACQDQKAKSVGLTAAEKRYRESIGSTTYASVERKAMQSQSIVRYHPICLPYHINQSRTSIVEPWQPSVVKQQLAQQAVRQIRSLWICWKFCWETAIAKWGPLRVWWKQFRRLFNSWNYWECALSAWDVWQMSCSPESVSMIHWSKWRIGVNVWSASATLSRKTRTKNPKLPTLFPWMYGTRTTQMTDSYWVDPSETW